MLWSSNEVIEKKRQILRGCGALAENLTCVLSE